MSSIPQAIYDLVGDKLQEVFDAQVVDIGMYDEESGLVHFPYTSSAASASTSNRYPCSASENTSWKPASRS